MVDGTQDKNIMIGLFGLILALSTGLLVAPATTQPVQASTDGDYACVDLGPNVTSRQLSDDVTDDVSSKNVGMDEALLVVVPHVTEKVKICSLRDVCWQCPPVKLAEIHPGRNHSFVIPSQSPTTLVVYHGNTTLCRLRSELTEYSKYYLWVYNLEAGNNSCNFYTGTEGPMQYLPIFVMLGVLAGTAILWIIVKALHRRGCFYRFLFCMEEERLINNDLGTPLINDESESVTKADTDAVTSVTSPRKQRLRSLDAFRGFSLVIMIFVNYKGGDYWFFHHSAWNGLTLADLVFPWFIFIMGTSMALSFRGLLRKTSRKQVLKKVVRRTVILFFLGLVISNRAKHGRDVDLKELRIPGVLQRIAVVYLIVGLLESAFAKAEDIHTTKWWSGVRDVLTYWPEWLVVMATIALHTCLTFFLPVPDCPTGYLGPGGLHEDRKFWNCTGGAAGHVDRAIFGERHMYGHPTCKNVYFPKEDRVAFDPEGLLGCLTATLICFLGLQAGKTLITFESPKSRVVRWIAWTTITGAVGGALCNFSQNDGVIPVNKNLWSLSFVLVMASMAFFLLSVFYLLIDVLKIWPWTPFFYTGMNSILIYMCHEVFEDYFPVSFRVPNTHTGHLCLSAWGACLWVLVSYVLYRKKIFIAI